MKKLSLKNRESSLTARSSSFVVFITALFFCFAAQAFAEGITSNKTVITGDEMEILKSGNVTISRGGSKAVNGRNTIEADVMTYDKKKEIVDASGKVKLFSKTDEGEPVKAYGDHALYDLKSEKGRLWGKKTYVEYFMKNSDKPLMLNAKEIDIDRNLETLSAYENVEIITTSGTIVSDNAVFDKKTYGVVMVKDKKRPLADVYYDGRNGLYEADKMVFYNADSNKKIIMSGNVTGKIEMEDGFEKEEKPSDKNNKSEKENKKAVKDKKREDK